MAAPGFLSHYLSDSLSYVQRHITVNKNVFSASLNKTFPFFPLQKNCYTLMFLTTLFIHKVVFIHSLLFGSLELSALF